MVKKNEVVGVVGFFSNLGILTADMAVRADSYIREYTEEIEDREAVVLICEKTGETLAVFHQRESSAFLDWCFLNGLILIPEIASLLNAVNLGRANGIAARVVEQKRLKEFAFMGRNYYAQAAHNILNEVVYNSTEWKIVRLESIDAIDVEIPRTKNSPKGYTYEENRQQSRFLINGEFVVENSEVTRDIQRQFLKCENSLIAVSPSGQVSIPRFRESYFDEKTQSRKFRFVGIDPTFSFMRISYTIVQNNFFSLELGPQSRKHQEFAAEYKDARQSAGERDNFDPFEFVANSPDFSQQEKQISESLFLTTEKQMADVIFNTPDKVQLSTVLLREWFETFCGVSNNRPHFDHFRKMVRNFKKHVRRETAEETKTKEKRTNRAMIAEVIAESSVEFVELRSRPILKPFSQFWNEYNSCPAMYFQTVKTFDKSTTKPETTKNPNSGIFVRVVGRRGILTDEFQPSSDFCKSIANWSKDGLLKDSLNQGELLIRELMKHGY